MKPFLYPKARPHNSVRLKPQCSSGHLMASHPSFSLLLSLLSVLRLNTALPYSTFIFGDSLVDAGNNNYLFTISKANSPPYGIDFAPSGGQPTGRFTNGRTTMDLIVEAVGDKSFPPPYLAPDATNTLLRGVNYASGASGILDETGSLFIERIPLSKQVQYFEETREYMVREEGEKATNEFLKNAVFAITTGSNDILNYVEPSIPFLGEKIAPTVLQDTLVSNMTSHLKRLHELGARKFLVNGVGPLGCIPYIRVINLAVNEQCSSEVNRIIQGYNIKLMSKINKLNEELGPESLFVYGNSYNIVRDIIQNYRGYGFENANDPCCGLSFPPLLCFSNSSAILCKNRGRYVFWDAYHPTEATNNIIFNKLLDDERATSPFSLRRLYSGQH